MTAGIRAVAYVLPDTVETLDDLERTGRLETPADRLRGLGFGHVRVSAEPAHVLALEAARRLLASAGAAPESIDAIFYAGALPQSHVVGAGARVVDGFRYPVSHLHYELGLINATATGISQTGCTGLMTAVRLAVDLLAASPSAARVLCASADVLPPGAPREFIYNVVSDGACAVLVERDAPSHRIVAMREITKGYYWDAPAMKLEIAAAYFPTGQHLARELLADAAMTPDDVDHVIPHNVSLRSWEILLRLIGISGDRLYTPNIAAIGHVIAADNFINLKDACDAGRVRKGDRSLLFNFGYGAHWSGMVIEH